MTFRSANRRDAARLIRGACAAAAASCLALPSLAAAQAASALPVFDAASAAPPVARVIRPVSAFACRTDSSDARAEAVDHLRAKAEAVGATGVVGLKVEVVRAQVPSLKNGYPNPCLYATEVQGTAVVLMASAG